jgi:hypothetical protein
MKEGKMNMAQELDIKIRLLRAELTRIVHEGNDEDGIQLRRLLAELERLENQRLDWRGYRLGYSTQGGVHANLAA